MIACEQKKGILQSGGDPRASIRWLQQAGRHLHSGIDGAESRHELFSHARKLFQRHGRQAVDKKSQIGADQVDSRSFALSRVPTRRTAGVELVLRVFVKS